MAAVALAPAIVPSNVRILPLSVRTSFNVRAPETVMSPLSASALSITKLPYVVVSMDAEFVE